ncbi:MAG: hypothetical protein FJ284_03465 [Planctomycetes bacterium]|nr:hypothetical protein [Planctomycetota bacterium]
MASICTGVSATWGGDLLGEVTEINVERGGDLPLGRASTWTLDAGTIQIKCLSTANLSASEYGRKKVFAVTGGGLTFSTKAVCQTLRLAGKVNDVARYEASFKIHAS